MNLFTRYVRMNFWAMLTVFVIGTGVLYFSFRHILIKQLDEMLEVEEEENLHYIGSNHALQPVVSTSDQLISYRPVSGPVKREFRIVELEGEEGPENFRQLSFPVIFDGRNYQYTVSVPLENAEELLRVMALVTLTAITLMLTAIYLINRSLIKRILRPFYRTIDAVGRYSLSRRIPLQLPKTSTQEFTALNETLNDLTERVLQDYQLVRNFTANAAHEIQTPLSVLRNKLETLMQTFALSEEQATQIAAIDDTVERITRLFHALLLLTKIENRQFAMDEQVAVDTLLFHKLDELSELMTAGAITVDRSVEPVRWRWNEYLADILVGNLLNNAIRYNHPGGSVTVKLSRYALEIANSSEMPKLNDEGLFQPFFRHPDNRQKGNGLGLSIVKQICEVSGFSVRYEWAPGLHRFTVLSTNLS